MAGRIPLDADDDHALLHRLVLLVPGHGQVHHALEAAGELAHLYDAGANEIISAVLVIVPHRQLQGNLPVVGEHALAVPHGVRTRILQRGCSELLLGAAEADDRVGVQLVEPTAAGEVHRIPHCDVRLDAPVGYPEVTWVHGLLEGWRIQEPSLHLLLLLLDLPLPDQPLGEGLHGMLLLECGDPAGLCELIPAVTLLHKVSEALPFGLPARHDLVPGAIV
mmetsp:Transcript_72512/g.216348  ORF Transcript_72512/g.216348 Transcript_72512/m.216348 type:complete len:221 (-) Transcript_72512:1683-2345(-)